MNRLRHAGRSVQNLKQALAAGRRPLCAGEHAAHRFEARVEATDVGQEGHQHANRDPAAEDLPGTDRPDHQQADLGEQGHRRPEEGP